MQKLIWRNKMSHELLGVRSFPGLIRQLSATASKPLPDVQTDKYQPPRWSYTSERLKMPVRVRLVDPNKKWVCNKDPNRLDRFYVKFLGIGGDKLLSEEVKWLAVTHKSFEAGARGFNDRLAFLGRRILNLHTTLALVSSPSSQISLDSPPTSEDRVPFTHSSLMGLSNLNDRPPTEILTKESLAVLGSSAGLKDVIRWVPRNTRDLESSGIEVVMATSVYAIFGALALENGGEVAANLARTCILKPLQVT